MSLVFWVLWVYQFFGTLGAIYVFGNFISTSFYSIPIWCHKDCNTPRTLYMFWRLSRYVIEGVWCRGPKDCNFYFKMVMASCHLYFWWESCMLPKSCGWRGLLKKLEIYVFLDSNIWTPGGQAGVSFRPLR